MVPNKPSLGKKHLHEVHDTKLGGHLGVLRTFKKLAQKFYWPSVYKTVQEYVKNCQTCQRTKTEALAPAGLIQPLSIPCQVWDDVTLDFI